MRPVLKRIAVNGLITALVLGALGFLFSEMAGIWMAGNTPIRAEPVENTTATTAAANTAPVGDTLHSRVPLMMAVWGFAFIAVSELVLYWCRGSP
ncbi:MAG TPA: hypothetical protein VKE74_08210, partial [Gemmataceae bacterium]|nr:hypothetical protein [Gemmataceae bacterium]